MRSWRDVAEPACAIGFFAAVVVITWNPTVFAEPPGSPAAVMLGAAAVVTVLWLTLSGFFGYGSACRGDWVALVPFVIALIVREAFTLHSIQEIEIQFARRPYDKHSVVYPLLQIFFLPIVRDPHRFTMHINGILGALACLPLHLFVRQRLESRTAGFLCALFLALHPLVARFSPTDGPYALLLFSWFSGLTLLSAPHLEARGIIGGALLLGIAATVRIEGLVILAASLLMLDVRLLAEALRRQRTAAVVSLVGLGVLVALQMTFVWQFNLGNVPALPNLQALLEPLRYGGPLVGALLIVGALSGVVTRRRLGLLAAVAMLVVVAPVAHSTFPIALHRLVPALALQAMVAGIGAYSLTAWLAATGRWGWIAAVPGILAACALFIGQRDDVTRRYVFNEEYALVRRHMAPANEAASSCTLFTFKPGTDVDMHDFAQAVPHLTVLDCNRTDCAAALHKQGCFYYVRSAFCYFHAGGLAAACPGTDRKARGCLSAPCAAFEREVELRPVETMMLDLRFTFPESRDNYPRHAEIGLYRVYSIPDDRAEHGPYLRCASGPIFVGGLHRSPSTPLNLPAS